MSKYKPLILIVDDTELNRSFLRDILEEEYNIIEASNGMDAISEIEKHKSDIAIVLLDVVMPVMDGFGVLAVMKKRHWIESIPVVMISAETSPDYISNGYELGAVDYISRPFDVRIVQRRVKNTITLYAKQKALRQIVSEQIKEKQRSNALMVDILSTIVEFRNGESGLHVLRIRIITEILLEALEKHYPKYNLTSEKISVISNAAALHDVGKIAIPEEILNKPGKLTKEEFEVIKTHSALGAKMLDEIHYGKDEELVRYAHDICLYHHERWDGRGYPEGISGNSIPIWAQVVALADVYDALVSERVYKPAYPHSQSIKMILNGECGAFNQDLLDCLIAEEAGLEERIKLRSETQNALFDVDEITEKLIIEKNTQPSDRTIFLLEQERIKYQFLSDISNELIFDYDYKSDTITFSEKGAKELGCNINITNFRNGMFESFFMSTDDFEDLRLKIRNSSPDNPVIQAQYIIGTHNNEKRWYEIIIKTLWFNNNSYEFVGCIGKMIDIHEQKLENFRLKKLAERDSLTNLYNRSTARKLIENFLENESDKKAALLFFDIDNFKSANDQYGHIFGDEILKYVAATICSNIRKDDIAARAGGDEFLVFLKNIMNVEDIEKYVKRLCRSLKNTFRDYRFSISMGVAIYPDNGKNYEQLLMSADWALYESKNKGKDQYVFYNENIKQPEIPTMLSNVEQAE